MQATPAASCTDAPRELAGSRGWLGCRLLHHSKLLTRQYMKHRARGCEQARDRLAGSWKSSVFHLCFSVAHLVAAGCGAGLAQHACRVPLSLCLQCTLKSSQAVLPPVQPSSDFSPQVYQFPGNLSAVRSKVRVATVHSPPGPATPPPPASVADAPHGCRTPPAHPQIRCGWIDYLANSFEVDNTDSTTSVYGEIRMRRHSGAAASAPVWQVLSSRGNPATEMTVLCNADFRPPNPAAPGVIVG